MYNHQISEKYAKNSGEYQKRILENQIGCQLANLTTEQVQKYIAENRNNIDVEHALLSTIQYLKYLYHTQIAVSHHLKSTMVASLIDEDDEWLLNSLDGIGVNPENYNSGQEYYDNAIIGSMWLNEEDFIQRSKEIIAWKNKGGETNAKSTTAKGVNHANLSCRYMG